MRSRFVVISFISFRFQFARLSVSLEHYHYLPPLPSAVVTRFIATMVDSDFHIFFFKFLRFGRLNLNTAIRAETYGSPKFLVQISTGSPTFTTPVRKYCSFVSRFGSYNFLLLARFLTRSALTKTLFSRLISFTLAIGFRLDSFAVYASSYSLPTMTQDSLYSGIGSPSITGLSPVRFVRLLLAHQKPSVSEGVLQ